MTSAPTAGHTSAVSKDEPAEVCLRCGAPMSWVHGTFQCPRCRFKIGCCEGNTAECQSG